MVQYITDLCEISELSTKEKEELKEVTDQYSFKSNNYYLSLIDWDDPDDPIRRLIIPSRDELTDWGELDPSNEEKYTVLRGLQHKYNSTALLLVSNDCGGICRYCFRKRIFIREQIESVEDYQRAVDYIKEHKEITNVLLTGGDPLAISTERLTGIISKLREIEHVKIIRIGSKMVAYNPYRIIEDEELLDMISKYSRPERRIYIMTHFTHPRELSKTAVRGVNLLREAGAALTNQTPMINGINSDVDTLTELFQKLSYSGIPPYYVFQCRPSSGNKQYSVPVEEALDVFEEACARVSGLAKRASFVMSHSSGKIQVIGKDDQYIYFKYRRAYRDEDSNKFIKARRNKEAYWLDDYEIVQ
ncbi:MAG TPA: KamA family radical SAM protein [Halanaerobiales bacterium]|nr:KamA family radical SAM protein [Halanaerobiales bacterium]